MQTAGAGAAASVDLACAVTRALIFNDVGSPQGSAEGSVDGPTVRRPAVHGLCALALPRGTPDGAGSKEAGDRVWHRGRNAEHTS